MGVIQTTVSGAVLVLAVTVIRALALHRLPKAAFPILWYAAALRLLLPIRIPSRLSVYTAIGRLLSNRAAAAAVFQTTPLGRAGDYPAAAYTAAAPAVSAWTVIWAAGVVIAAAVFAACYVRSLRSFRRSRPVRNDTITRLLQGRPIRRPVRVRCSDGIGTPLTYGILRPTILLPETTDFRDTELLTCVVTHEYVHIRRFDGLGKLVLTAAVCVHWFNPLAWAMIALADRDIEMACDEAVVRALGGDARSAYALALIRMEERRRGLAPIINHFNKNAIEERIIAIMKFKNISVLSVVLAIVIVLGTVTVFATSASAVDAEPAETDAAVEDDAAMTETAIARLAENHPKVAEWLQESYSDAVWWTYEGYKAASDQYLQGLKDSLGEPTCYDRDGNLLVMTEEWIDQETTNVADTLQKLQGGIIIPKSIHGDTDWYTEIDPVYIESLGSREYECSIDLLDGTEKHFGPYDTLEEFRAEVEPFCREQLKAGNLSQQDMNEIAAFFSAQ